VLDHQKEQIAVQKRLAIVHAKLAKLQNAIAGLRIQYGQYDDVFDRVSTLATDINNSP